MTDTVPALAAHPVSLTTHVAPDLRNEAFWREAFPDLTIIDSFRGSFVVNTPHDEAAAVASRKMQVEGYFQEHDDALVDISYRLSHAISRCVELGIPPVFIFLFDEAWAAFHRQHRIISRFLGADYQVLPDFWAWHVDPRAGQAGWRPHRDKGHTALARDGSPLSLTMWVPLSEASPSNGCMYMLPANRDPVYGTENDKNWQVEFPFIRALPGGPGDFFIWNQAVLHWGAQSSPFSETPRMSMALEFQRADIQPFNLPLLGTLPVLDFPSRLKLVAKQILQYQHMYPLPAETQAMAQQVLDAG